MAGIVVAGNGAAICMAVMAFMAGYGEKVFGEALTSRRIDPVSLDHINVCNEWLIGEVVNDDDVGKDLIFEGETLDWQTAHVASGTGEPESRTRSTPGKRKEPSTDVSYAARARATTTKKDTSTSTSRSNRIEQQVEEEVDDINDVGSEEPALEDDDLVDESSEGEEEEGYASLDDQEVD